MATYEELQQLFSNDALTVKTQVAVVVAAYNLVKSGELPTADQISWSAAVLDRPGVEAAKALKFILAKNAEASVATILAADKTTVQTHVDEIIPSLVAAHAGA